mgnify:CR=1 FL=1
MAYAAAACLISLLVPVKCSVPENIFPCTKHPKQTVPTGVFKVPPPGPATPVAGGTIFSGIFNKPYDIATKETRQGVLITMIPAALIILLIRSPFQGLIYSQMLLAVQLPITIFTQIYLTSSKKVMGKYANSTGLKMVLWAIAIVVTALNIGLFVTGF